MAHELGKHLHEAIGWDGPVTHRQFLAWIEWFVMEKNRPSRTDHYLMQIAMEIRCVPFSLFSPTMPALKLDQFRIPFKVVTEQAFNPEGSKSIWLGILKASSKHHKDKQSEFRPVNPNPPNHTKD